MGGFAHPANPLASPKRLCQCRPRPMKIPYANSDFADIRREGYHLMLRLDVSPVLSEGSVDDIRKSFARQVKEAIRS